LANIEPKLSEIVISDNEGPYRLFVDKSILKDNDNFNYFLGNNDKLKNKKNAQTQNQRKSGRISNQQKKGNN
jgi:hypothetical protein